MNRKFIICAASIVAFSAAAKAGYTITFEDLSYQGAGEYENGSNLSGSFSSGGSSFANLYDSGFWSGFSYSKVSDSVTPGFGNQYAAVTGGGVDGSASYAVGYRDLFDNVFPTITLPQASGVAGLYVTNTTYAYDAIANGDDGSGPGNGFVRQFGTNPPGKASGNQGYPDAYKLTISGQDAGGNPTGSVDFFLADYRFADNAQDYAVSDWKWVDLSALGPTTQKIVFDADSTDTGRFGINTPTYFAIDNVVVPEPASCGIMLCSGGMLVLRRRRNG